MGILDIGLEQELDDALIKINLMSKEMNQISDVLLGYQEGSFHEIITKARTLKVKAMNTEIENKFSEVAEAINDLNTLVDDIQQGA